MTDSMDKARIRRAFDRIASGFEQADFLHEEIRDRLLGRLTIVTIHPERILDLGSGTGVGARRLAELFPKSNVTALDLSIGMLAAFNSTHVSRAGSPDNIATNSLTALCADAENLPINDQSFDLIFSNLLLQHCRDPIAVLAEARRTLRYPGVFTFTTCGPDSLWELREAWLQADRYSHIAPFMDMHDLGDALIQSGFAEPVMYKETIRVTYQALPRAMADLRGIGSINATNERNRGLTSPRTWQRLVDGYEKFRADDGKLPVTLEVIYGLAWSGQPDAGAKLVGGEFEIPVDDLRILSRK